jgi:hypothetical protein
MSLKIHSKEAFAKAIESAVRDKGMTYMEAVLGFCNERELEPQAIVPFLTDKIRTEIHREGKSLHLLPKSDELPI